MLDSNATIYDIAKELSDKYRLKIKVEYRMISLRGKGRGVPRTYSSSGMYLINFINGDLIDIILEIDDRSLDYALRTNPMKFLNECLYNILDYHQLDHIKIICKLKRK